MTTPQKEAMDLTQTITEFYSTYSGDKSKNIWIGDDIQNKHKENHCKAYLTLSEGEKPLVLLNKGALFWNFTGLVITNYRIHFCTLKKSFFAGTLPWLFMGEKGAEVINGLKSVEIAELDTCFGNSYVGHELRINGRIIGYVRIGTGILFDEQAIEFLNGLFNHFAEKNIIDDKVSNYNWQ